MRCTIGPGRLHVERPLGSGLAAGTIAWGWPWAVQLGGVAGTPLTQKRDRMLLTSRHDGIIPQRCPEAYHLGAGQIKHLNSLRSAPPNGVRWRQALDWIGCPGDWHRHRRVCALHDRPATPVQSDHRPGGGLDEPSGREVHAAGLEFNHAAPRYAQSDLGRMEFNHARRPPRYAQSALGRMDFNHAPQAPDGDVFGLDGDGPAGVPDADVV